MRRPLLAVLVALVASLGVLVAPSSPAVAADEVTVTWPSVTAFNPDTTTYEITVEDSIGTGVLVAKWQNDRQQVVSGSGSTTLSFATSDTGAVTLWRCKEPGPNDCDWVGSSPDLEVYRELIVYGDLNVADALDTRSLRDGAGRAVIEVRTRPNVSDDAVTASWELVDRRAPRAVRASGSSIAISSDNGLLGVPFTIPAGLESTTYRLRLHIAAATARFGKIEGSTELLVPVDQVAPTVSVTGGAPTIFPTRDGYLDETTFSIHRRESTWSFYELRDSRGVVVKRDRARVPSGGTVEYTINGRSGGSMLPEGRYSIELGVKDWFGNTGSSIRTLRVSHLERRWLNYRRTVPAAPYLTSRFVGRCSSLTSRGRKLVYASQSKCRGSKEEDALVVARHGIYVPVAIHGRYGSFRVTVNGEPASRASRNYLVLGYIDGEKLTNRVVLRGGRRHRGPTTGASRLVFDRRGAKPYVIWSTGLTAGSRYVVRSFTVEMTYYTLARPQRGRRAAVETAVPTWHGGVEPASYL